MIPGADLAALRGARDPEQALARLLRLLAVPSPTGATEAAVAFVTGELDRLDGVTTYEEVGHGGAALLPVDVEELVVLDMAAVGEGQTSRETGVTLCVKDASGPYDARLGRHLRQVAHQADLDLAVDVYPFYASDGSAAWRGGADVRVALVGPGVDASHAFERTHVDALSATFDLVAAYALSAEA